MGLYFFYFIGFQINELQSHKDPRCSPWTIDLFILLTDPYLRLHMLKNITFTLWQTVFMVLGNLSGQATTICIFPYTSDVNPQVLTHSLTHKWNGTQHELDLNTLQSTSPDSTVGRAPASGPVDQGSILGPVTLDTVKEGFLAWCSALRVKVQQLVYLYQQNGSGGAAYLPLVIRAQEICPAKRRYIGPTYTP